MMMLNLQTYSHVLRLVLRWMVLKQSPYLQSSVDPQEKTETKEDNSFKLLLK